MAQLKYNGVRPKAIVYNGKQVKKVVYNGVVVWRAMDSYKIVGTIYGEGDEVLTECVSDNCNCGTDTSNCNCSQCERSVTYSYHMELTFSGVHRFPICYISKSGAKISIDKTKVTGDKGIYKFVSDDISAGNSYNQNKGIDLMKSLYPDHGVTDYSSIWSINITSKDNGTQTSNCTNCGDQTNCISDNCRQDDCDCAGDMDCDGY